MNTRESRARGAMVRFLLAAVGLLLAAGVLQGLSRIAPPQSGGKPPWTSKSSGGADAGEQGPRRPPLVP